MTNWQLLYTDWNPEQQPLREALTTVGNGYFASRGAAEESVANDHNYPGTYLAGGYNRLTTEISGREIENEDLVNWPNWLRITFRHNDESNSDQSNPNQWFHAEDCEILDFNQQLDLRSGTLSREIRFRDPHGRTSTIKSRRFVSMAHQHLAAIQWTLTPNDWSGPITVRSEIDGEVTNEGVERYKQLRGDHTRITETSKHTDDTACLVAQSTQSLLRVAMAVRNRLTTGDTQPETFKTKTRVGHDFHLTANSGETIILEKTCALFTHRDHAISEPALEARNAAAAAARFDDLLDTHKRAWTLIWKRCDISVAADDFTQRTIRLHIFHLLQTCSPHTIHLDVGVPARGWHGEAYRGHIFWDELFILPYLTVRIPELTRALLMYRYRRLEKAREAAKDEGYRGAMFPWQSGSNGREESQRLHLNPRSGRWIPDHTHLQRHINAAIAFNVWQYYQATDDEEFLSFYGAEMILEIARFWASIAQWNPDRDRYDILSVVGPDEFQTQDPNSDEPGLSNNAYTNIMAAWTIRCARRALHAIPDDRVAELREQLDISDDELERWDHIASNLHIPFHDGGIISQFEGYEELEEFDWEGYKEKYDDIQRLDRILESEGDSPNNYKASKQADVLMLFYLFSAEELAGLFEQLGYDFDENTIPRNIRYYNERTSHGSTLSRVVSVWVDARARRDTAWSVFESALESDVNDIQGGTTCEGIHLGAMAGTVDIMQRCYTGMEIREDVLWFAPFLPPDLSEIRFVMRFRGHTLSLDINHEQLKISSCKDGPRPIKIGINGRVSELYQGHTRTEKLKAAAQSST